VIAHELAHMWFGDLVTMRWWDDLWLNESFASWMGTRVMDEVFPEFRDGQSAMDGRYRAMSTDARLSTGAMRQPIESEDNLSANANELTYSKGRAVLCMFEGWLGAERFRSGVIEYLAKHEWGNATGGDLWSAISHASGDNIDPAMSSFLDQPGVPLVTIEPLASGRVRLRQQRFLSSGEAPAKPTLWRVPVVLGYPDGNATQTHRAWLDKAEMEVTLEGGTHPAWLLPNSGATAYYVWSVPLEMLSAIARDRGRLSPAERVGYVRNLIALQSAGRIPVERFLPLLNAFRDDPEPEVVAAVVAALEAIREPLVSPELEPLFAQQVRQLLQPALERMGREPRTKELPAASLTRPKLLRALGDMGRDPETNAWAEATTRRILDKTAVDASLADAALPLSANHGDLQLETRFRERFESATDPGERSRFLEALGAFRDPARVQELLDYSLSATMRPQEVITLPTQLAEWPGNRDALYRWLTGHYDAVSHRIPSHMFARMMPIVRGCSSERMADARTFFANPEHTFPGASFVMARTADAVGDCVRIAERDRARFAEYLRGTARTP